MTSTTNNDTTTDAEIAEILATDGKVTPAQYASMVAYVNRDRLTFAEIAYAIRTRGVEGIDDKSTLSKFATDTGLNRSALSQWASAVGYLVESKTDVNRVTFAYALRAYGYGAAGRKVVREGIANIALLSPGKRESAWKRLADAAGRAKVAPAPNVPTIGADDKGEAPGEATRVARPGDGTNIASTPWHGSPTWPR
jgi:hypothetical protein